MAIIPSSLFPTKTAASSSAYPHGAARDVTAPGDRTGTPWVADLLNDIWGFLQALLDATDITPSGSPDQVGASDYLDAIKELAGNPGEHVFWAGEATVGVGTVDPSTLGFRLLPCYGQTVLVADYPELASAAYVGDASNATAGSYYRCDNSDGTSRSTSGVYLKLPDLRGYFLRGEDPAGTSEPGGDTRVPRTTKVWSLIDHEHYISDRGGSIPVAQGYVAVSNGTAQYWYERTAGFETSTDLKAGTVYGISGHAVDEVAPNNFSLLACVRY